MLEEVVFIGFHDVGGDSDELVVGKVYKLLENWESQQHTINHYPILTPSNDPPSYNRFNSNRASFRLYPKGWFVSVDEWREIKLNIILNDKD